MTAVEACSQGLSFLGDCWLSGFVIVCLFVCFFNPKMPLDLKHIVPDSNFMILESIESQHF